MVTFVSCFLSQQASLGELLRRLARQCRGGQRSMRGGPGANHCPPHICEFPLLDFCIYTVKCIQNLVLTHSHICPQSATPISVSSCIINTHKHSVFRKTSQPFMGLRSMMSCKRSDCPSLHSSHPLFSQHSLLFTQHALVLHGGLQGLLTVLTPL